ncbi:MULTISPECIES: glycosyltransferase family 2 protein [unclassified Micromonospora]|uniref:glycosyltransferase family 2 protein n=1 Tax=unclassified Micromonospora TaxID=2617518 RepID=UPI00259C96FD|nr:MULTISPECIES: glycosyltransferase family 2 protein [unclassified Micromonospora]MDM4780302.1 glycosyltransferase family 2 protein [Micromonospora sp. b486]
MIVLVPVYRPGDRLPPLVGDLRAALPGADVLVVDDGSGPAAAGVLRAARDRGATVLRRRVNRGKGVVLRTGFRYASTRHPGRVVVCVDADGQHGVPDVCRVADRMLTTGAPALGVREFDGEVPARSRFGNAATRVAFRLATGRDVRDTQTGLRAYPAALLGWLTTIPGDRFEYEMTVLLRMVRAGLPVEQVNIVTRYHGDNSGSHFSALADSVRIYRPLAASAVARLLSPTPSEPHPPAGGVAPARPRPVTRTP